MGRIDLILCKSVSRFGRNSVDVLRTIRALRERGIGVMFEKEGVDTRTMNSELILAFHSAFSQSESESIRENVRRGLHMAYAQGTVTIPSNTYGFCEGTEGEIAIDPEQAPVIRSIYQWFLDGSSLQMIGKRLENQGTPSPKGKEKWSIATIRSILSNVKYKGDVLLQKTYKPSLFSDHAIENNGDLPKYYIAGCLPQILEPGIFDRAQEELAKRVSKRPASEKQKRHSVGTVANTPSLPWWCAASAAPCTGASPGTAGGKVKVVWRCGAHQDKAASCPDSPTIEEAALQSAVMEAISQQCIHKGEAMEITMQSIRSVLTPGNR